MPEVLGENSENGPKVDRLENRFEDVIARSKGTRGIRKNAWVSGLCLWVDTGIRARNMAQVILIWRLFMRWW